MRKISRRSLIGLNLVLVLAGLIIVALIIFLSRRKLEYQVYPGLAGTDNSCANVTLVLPPNYTSGSSYNLNVANILVNSTTADIPGNADFALSWNKASNGKILAVVNVGNTANNQWKCGADARQTLANNFLDFHKQLWEQLEIQKKILVPGGAALIMQRIADVLPVTYSESLFYHYGFSSGFTPNPGPYVDLKPGMRLRVETEANQYVQPGSNLNGLVANSENFYTIGSFLDANGNQRLSFNAFLSAISAPSINISSNSTVVDGLIDLSASGTARRYLRLFYPAQMLPASSPGAPGINSNATIIGADSLEDMAAATKAYLGGYQCATAATGNKPIECLSFRGRTTLVPEISIFVNKQQIFVPVGTTIRNVAEGMFSFNPGSWDSSDTSPITLFRHWTEDNAEQSPKYVRVNFNPLQPNIAAQTAYELPVLMGDSFTFSTGE